MNLNDNTFTSWARQRAEQTIEENLAVLSGIERKEFALDALHWLESQDIPGATMDHCYEISIS